MDGSNLRDFATDGIKFWEPWRLFYNLTLAAIVIIYFAIGYPSSKTAVSIDFCLGLFLLAVIANVLYCAAYVVDIFAQASGFRDLWRDTASFFSSSEPSSPPSSPGLSRWTCSTEIVSN